MEAILGVAFMTVWQVYNDSKPLINFIRVILNVLTIGYWYYVILIMNFQTLAPQFIFEI
jgi:hypothetical protein